jgi:nitroreductase
LLHAQVDQGATPHWSGLDEEMSGMDASPRKTDPRERVGLTVEEAIVGRQSIRAFLADPVARPLVERILTIAGRAPSGSNIQPWKVWVMDGAVKDAISKEILAAFDAGVPEAREYNYYPVDWREPYLGRRRACGWGLYSTMGITRDDKEGMKRQRGQNYLFFGAPTALIFTIDRDMEIGSWLDTGMFLQSIMIAARQFGLETCPQAALANYAEILERRLAIPSTEMVVCGMALGYPDTNAKVNSFRTEREPIERYVRWVERLAE